MLENFLVSLGVVGPMALLMATGALIRYMGIVDRPTMEKVNKLIFRLFTPALLFTNIYEADYSAGIDGRAVAFALCGLGIVFYVAMFVLPNMVPDKNQAASLGQAIVRPNYVIFGIAVAESLYGEGHAGMVAVLGAVVVPVINVFSSVLLERNRSGGANVGKLALAALKNPMVVATVLALCFAALPVSIPSIVYSAVKDLSGVATTLSFLSLGVSLDLGETRANRKPLLLGVGLRMLVIPLLAMPLAVAMGFRNEALCALMLVFAAPAAVASYPMAVAMGADGPLAGQLVCVTTLLSIITIFCYTFLFRSLGML